MQLHILFAFKDLKILFETANLSQLKCLCTGYNKLFIYFIKE
jgi:hypothetical protein